MKNKKILFTSFIYLTLCFCELGASEKIDETNNLYSSYHPSIPSLDSKSSQQDLIDDLFKHYQWVLKKYKEQNNLLEEYHQNLIQKEDKLLELTLELEKYRHFEKEFKRDILELNPHFNFDTNKLEERKENHLEQSGILFSRDQGFEDLICSYQWTLSLLDEAYDVLQKYPQETSQDIRTKLSLQHNLEHYIYLEQEIRSQMKEIKPNIQFESLPFIQPNEADNEPLFNYLTLKQKFKLPD